MATAFPETLALWQIGYEHIAELGGLRGKARGGEPSPNAYWRVRGFRNYADYALTTPFAEGLARLRELGGQHRCAIMCAEAVWWRCHRRMITDYLLSQGERVVHIMGPSHVDEASVTRAPPSAAIARSSIRPQLRIRNNAIAAASAQPPNAIRGNATIPVRTARP